MESSTSKSPNPYLHSSLRNSPASPDLSIHSGRGPLRGGGVTKLYGSKPSVKDYKRKLDNRLGIVICFCLTTIATILFIYGLFYEQVQGSLVEYVQGVKEDLDQPPTTSPIPEDNELTSTIPIATTIAIVQELRKTEKPNDLIKTQGSQVETLAHELQRTKREVPSTVPLENESASRNRRDDDPLPTIINDTLLPVETNNFDQISLITTTHAPVMTTTLEIEEILETTTLVDSSTEDETRLTKWELEAYSDRFQATHIAIWVLVALNLAVVMFLAPLIILFRADIFTRRDIFKTIYRAGLGLALLFTLFQLFYLFSPLLTCSLRFPRIMDRLFEEGLPRPEHLIEPIEQRFVCAFAFDKVLVEYRIQDPCIPKLKNYLLPSYTVILLIIIDLMPIAFVAFTYFWDSKIKELAPIRKLRHRIEMNHQQRPGSREGIYNNGFSNYQITNSANKQ
ncbi:hypothetical protein Ddc_13670 [Ditylenchus destructor]|nr:hypothetical protein Ddc_13670 [Ditylenchus destructor]